jgi:drug/metabolite transporter (DMT)-like permease
MKKQQLIPVIQAILAATLFGASAPISKLLLGEIHPIPLAGFLYLGSGLGLFFWQGISRLLKISSSEAHLTRKDYPWLAGAILAGGIIAPITLMFSLRTTPAATASLLLNFEGVATAIIAVIVFGEAIGSRIWLAIGCISLSTILLSLNPAGGWGFSIGALGVLVACILWGADNNLTRNISAKDPITIVAYKGLGAGSLSLLLAMALGIHFPTVKVVLECMFLGLLSYGLSIVLFILAMRSLGATRTVALFGSAPFVGTILSFIIFREAVSTLFFIGLPIMILGAFLLVGEEHSHMHEHHVIEHEHSHKHDDNHHNHVHLGEVKLIGDSHTHLHIHETKHSHSHTPDIHHRHSH